MVAALKKGDPPAPAPPPCNLIEAACVLESMGTQVERPCTKAIEGNAIYGLEWMDGFAHPQRFNHAAWLDEHLGHLSIGGEAVRIRNRFGALAQSAYLCTIDLNTLKVMRVSTWEGHFADVFPPSRAH